MVSCCGVRGTESRIAWAKYAGGDRDSQSMLEYDVYYTTPGTAAALHYQSRDHSHGAVTTGSGRMLHFGLVPFLSMQRCLTWHIMTINVHAAPEYRGFKDRVGGASQS